MGAILNLNETTNSKMNNITASKASTGDSADYTKESTLIDKVRHEYVIASVVLFFLLVGIGLEYYRVPFFKEHFALVWFTMLYIVIGGKTIIEAIILMISRDFYNDYVLVFIATLGAMLIGSYPVAVSVMLVFVISELFQNAAVNKVKRSISAMFDIRVDKVSLYEKGKIITKDSMEIEVGETIQVNPGEIIAFDGKLVSDFAIIVLTGDSVSEKREKGENVLAGTANLEKPILIEVTSIYKDSKLSKTLKLIQEASVIKNNTQFLISRLAKIYTQIVFWLAIVLVVAPFFYLGSEYEFRIWFERAMILLIISSPIAFTASISLGYFEGLAKAAKNGILFKKSDYLDKISKIDTVVLDKTGVLTHGIYKVEDVVTEDFNIEKLLKIVSVLEKQSEHAIAKAIVDYAQFDNTFYKTTNVKEFHGYGITGNVNKFEVIIGNEKLFDRYKIEISEKLRNTKDKIVFIAINKKFAGYIHISDNVNIDAMEAISKLHEIKKIKEIIMLSGDKQPVVDHVASQLGIDIAKGGLLNENKVKEVEELKKQNRNIAYVTDGITNLPILALSDIGIAMKKDIKINTSNNDANMIITSDKPSKIETAIQIGNFTKKIIWFNIVFVLSVKIVILMLASVGRVTMLEAIFIDLGMTLLTILNVVRIQNKSFS